MNRVLRHRLLTGCITFELALVGVQLYLLITEREIVA